MDTATKTDWFGGIPVTSSYVDSTNYDIEDFGDGSHQVTNGYPGVVLFVGAEKYYYFAAGDYEGDTDNPATAADFQRLGLTKFLADSFTDGDATVEKEHLNPSLVDYLWTLAEKEERRANWSIAEMQAQAEMLPDAVEYIVYSPRGFGNEISVYGVKEGEHDAAEAWKQEHTSINSWCKFVTPDAVKEMLDKSIYHSILAQQDRLEQQFVTATEVSGYWNAPTDEPN